MEAFKNFDKDDPSHVKAVLNWGKYFGYKNMSAEEINFNIGDIIGFWTVVGDGKEYVSPKGDKSKTTKVRCICGKEREVVSSTLNREKSLSCGCKGAPKKEKVEKIIPQDTEEEKWKQSDICVNYYFSSLGKVFNYNKQEYLDSNKSFIKYKRNKYNYRVGKIVFRRIL